MVINKSNVDYKKIYDLTQEDCVELGIKLNGVRLTDDKHIKEIASPIVNSTPMISCIEIDINTMGVVDGQHRFEAYKRAWAQGYTGTMEVRFLDVPEDIYNDIVRDKNIHSKNWTIKDYKRAALLGGNEAMIKINEFCMSHRLLHGKVRKDGTAPTKDRYAMAFLKGGNVTKEIKKNEEEVIKVLEDFIKVRVENVTTKKVEIDKSDIKKTLIYSGIGVFIIVLIVLGMYFYKKRGEL
jgi:hypothetical protein